MSIDIGIVTMSICPELKRQPWPTCRCAVSGSGPASALRMSWTPTGNSGETGPEFPCLQICSAGSRELCTAGPPGYQSFHLQHQSRPDSPKGPGWNLPITSYLGAQMVWPQRVNVQPHHHQGQDSKPGTEPTATAGFNSDSCPVLLRWLVQCFFHL